MNRRHQHKKNESISDANLLAGTHSVIEALRAGRRKIDMILAHESAATADVQSLARAANVQMRTVSDAELTRVCGHQRHQGLAARVGGYPYATWEEAWELAHADPKGALFLILDHIQDPQNFGAMIRTAHCAGVHAILVPKDRMSPVTATVVRASAGAAEHQRIVPVANLARVIEDLKAHHVWVVGADMHGTSLYEYRFDGAHAIVMGAEGEGLRRLVRDSCDTILSIPMRGKIDSLNVSAAAAIIIGEAVRQRMG